MRFECFVIFLTISCGTECAKILGILNVPGISHYRAGSTLMKILAEHGHEVTVVSPFGEKNPPKNYRDVIMTGVWDKVKNMNIDLFDLNEGVFTEPLFFSFWASILVEDLFNCTNFKNLMTSGEKFDLVIMEHFSTDAVKYISHYFKAPLIVYTSTESNDWINSYQGNPDNPAYLPIYVLHYTNEMNFLERVMNTIAYVYNQLFRVSVYTWSQNSILHKYYPDAPHLTEFIDNVSLVFVNTDPSTHEPLPRVPSIIGIGGFHIDEPKPLPRDLQDILDNAKNGVIYFNMGSNIQAKGMPQYKKDIFLRVFRKLKETVVWKFEDDNLPGKPDNVIIRNWLPQNDILAHENIKLFIAHGGIFGLLEAVHYGVPVITIPIFGDQMTNSKRAVAACYAKQLDFKTMTEQDLESTIKELLTNPEYTKNAKARSRIMHDKPSSPRDTVNYWVDYVIRHKGADHLRVASLKLKWYQYILLDVIAFIVITFLISLVTLKYTLKLLLRIISRRKHNEIKKKE